MTLRLGTRGSALARGQSQDVADTLAERAATAVDLVTITTLGDVHPGSLASLPQPGAFVSALREALLAGEVDFVVHSMKDLPSEPIDGIHLAAVPIRAATSDALVSTQRIGLAELPPGATVGTGSPRRSARIRAARPDVIVVGLRGNVDTRIERVRSGSIDAAVLAVAGLARLGRSNEIDEVIGADVILPAPAQGALAVECRAGDGDVIAALGLLDDPVSRLRVTAERAVLSALGASCASAIGALADYEAGTLTLTADVSGTSPNQHAQVHMTCEVAVDAGADSIAAALGLEAAQALLDAGAAEYVNPVAERD